MGSASLFLRLFCTILLVLATANTPPVTASEEFKVGDAEGWRQPGLNHTEMYNHWAARRRFHVGDSLRFEYKNDSVLVVNKWGYYHCNTSSPIFVFNDGNTVVNLDRPGPSYFISGDPDHCRDGQRLLVEVMNLHPPVSHTPPSIATPPQPYLPSSPAPSPLGSGSAAPSVSLKVISVLLAPLIVATIA
ncbi:hypothetical protein RJ639_040920 [Escallonia herrerae]|uniref:Phytocyanin domain-containing protein n=1 Tax=Escallonia herrerae TaxID=1293975 RepID=A0AA89B5P4_9ASTE|nr:hypothetical protein RJ639_040920 [Escallonia herrerae]